MMFGLSKKPEPTRWAEREFRDRLDSLIASASKAGVPERTIARVLGQKVEAMRFRHIATASVDLLPF